MQPPSSSEELAAALADGNTLLGSSSSNSGSNMELVLKNRLLSYYDRVFEDNASDRLVGLTSLEYLQILTAKEAISVLERIQNILNSEGDEKYAGNATHAPSIGTRDLAQLRTLLSLSFKWGTQLLFNHLFSKPLRGENGPEIVGLTLGSEPQMLANILTSLFSLVFAKGLEGPISQTLITTTILDRHISDLLLPLIALGWVPDSLSPNTARPMVIRILRLLSPAQAIISLGGILSSTSPPPPLPIRKACTSLLTEQLLRPEGVQGLYEAMFSSEETMGDEVTIEKLQQIAKILNTAPAGVKAQEYYRLIFPRVLRLLSVENRPSYRRAAAFTIYRAVMPPSATPNQSFASSTALGILHAPFLNLQARHKSGYTSLTPTLEPREALLYMTILLSNTEPSPEFISKILTPIFPALYLLSYDLDQIKTADPSLKESVTGLLVSWGKIVDSPEGSDVLWFTIESGKDGHWLFDPEGHFWRTESLNEPLPLHFLPQDVEEGGDSTDTDLNLFNLYPDPLHFVHLLKLFDRGDITSILFLRALENYRDMKTRLGEDSMKILHKLQIIIQMQNELSEGTASNIFSKPGHLLSFIFHVLESANIASHGGTSFNSESASLVSPSLSADDFEGDDSDDEAPDSEVIGADDELIETAITLLLSIIEADETLTARTHPIFNAIFSKLEPLALKGSSTLRPLAREARLTITAREACASPAGGSRGNNKGKEDTQDIYQRALKLLQDPVLPVRAHGLLLLRQLISPGPTPDHNVNAALVPSILSIFLQTVQDDDPYMFLNAVQGLAALVDTYGKHILQRLVHDYAGGLAGLGSGNLTQHDLDGRTRIGEALSTVIKRCGSALGLYVDILVPHLFSTVRGSDIPTILRTSSLSLLADCVDVYPWAMLPYTDDLCQAMVDLLRGETLPFRGRESLLKSSTSQPNEGDLVEENISSKPVPPTMDSDPTSRNSKFPPLRRAALHFLSLLIRSSTKIAYEGHGRTLPIFFSPATYQRMSVTLGYISSTDEDDIVRMMSREAKEAMERLQRAAFGL